MNTETTTVPGSVDYYNGSLPSIINDQSTIRASLQSVFNSISGQQLLVVGSLEDINPAVFTQVRIYNQDNIAIKLLRDQAYVFWIGSKTSL